MADNMYACVLAFLIGTLSLSWFHTIPDLWWFLPILVCAALAWRYAKNPLRTYVQWLLFALVGSVYVLWRAQCVLTWHLPENLATQTVTVVGVIAALPKVEDDTVQFVFDMTALNNQPQQARIQLTWYQFNGAPLRVGDHWRLQVRLKPPHGLLNPGSADYEQWLFAHRIRATGYVVTPSATANTLLSNHSWIHPIDSLRQSLQQVLHNHLAGQPTEGLIMALIMGAQQNITQPQWQVMRATGTNHLMAIAGVHIAFVAGFIYWLVNYLWRRSQRLLLKVPAPQAAACGSLIAAIIYSALAGFALPTQRALIMLSVCMLGLLLRRELQIWNSLALALLLILLWDPFATLSVSFWLSFGAVFAIIYGISGRLKPQGLWWKYGRVQWVITIALIPISLTLFQQTSLVAFIANLIAVPAVGILVLPLCLLGTLLLFIIPVAGHYLLIAAAHSIAIIWQLLAWLATLHGAIWQQPMPSWWILAAACVGVLLLLAPRGFPARWLGIAWLLPVIFFQPIAPAFGAVNFTLLDVGQGLAAVVQTQHHALLFDTGPPMRPHDDAGQRVILPFLHSAAITTIDTLMVSHGDSDHIGGAGSVLKQIPVAAVLTSVPERFQAGTAHLCQAGQTWQWDGVSFVVLYPAPQLLHLNNNSSCVLKVTADNASILLTGDIEKLAEQYLVGQQAAALSARILIAPHHGSSTSSTPEFVQAVKPTYVLFPVGYKNRFHFPHAAVVARFQQLGATQLATAQDGAIKVTIDKQGVKITTQREEMKRIWH